MKIGVEVVLFAYGPVEYPVGRPYEPLTGAVPENVLGFVLVWHSVDVLHHTLHCVSMTGVCAVVEDSMTAVLE